MENNLTKYIYVISTLIIIEICWKPQSFTERSWSSNGTNHINTIYHNMYVRQKVTSVSVCSVQFRSGQLDVTIFSGEFFIKINNFYRSSPTTELNRVTVAIVFHGKMNAINMAAICGINAGHRWRVHNNGMRPG